MELGRNFSLLLFVLPAFLAGCMAATLPEKKEPEIVVVDFDQVKQGLSDGSITYLDVRTLDEVEIDGKIPGSVIIPYPEFEEAFQLSDEAFQQKYCFPKPTQDMSNVVVGCHLGRRARIAVLQLQKMGFHSMSLYSGSFVDWKEKNGPIVKAVEGC